MHASKHEATDISRLESPRPDGYVSLLAGTVGRLERRIRTAEVPAGLIEPMCDMMGTMKPLDFLLVLDFREGANKIYIDPESPEMEGRASSVVDLLGCYPEHEIKGPTIVLFIDAIAACAKDLCCSPVVLGEVVFIHELAHLAHLGLWDAQFRKNKNWDYPNCPPRLIELIAQYATWQTIQKDITRLAVFEHLSEGQTEVYQNWELFKGIEPSDFSTYLQRLRENPTNPSWQHTAFAQLYHDHFKCYPGEVQVGDAAEGHIELPEEP